MLWVVFRRRGKEQLPRREIRRGGGGGAVIHKIMVEMTRDTTSEETNLSVPISICQKWLPSAVWHPSSDLPFFRGWVGGSACMNGTGGDPPFPLCQPISIQKGGGEEIEKEKSGGRSRRRRTISVFAKNSCRRWKGEARGRGSDVSSQCHFIPKLLRRSLLHYLHGQSLERSP